MTLARRVAENTVVQFVGKALSILLGLTTFAIIQRALHPEGFGRYTIIMSYLGFFSVIADLGLYVILIREINKPGADRDRVFANVLGIRLVSVATIFAIALVLLPFFRYPTAVGQGVAIGIAGFLAVAVTQLQVSIFQSTLTMSRVVLAEVLGRLVLLAGVVGAVHFHLGLKAIIVATVIASLSNCLILFVFSNKILHIRLSYDRAYWGYLLRETAPVAISVTLNLIYFRMDTIILSLYRSETEVGLYGAAYKILETLNTFPIMFVGLMLPILTHAFATDRARFQRIYQQAFDALWMGVVPLVIGGWFLARPIITLISGHEFISAAPILRLLLIAVGFLFLNSLSGHTVTVINRQRQMVWGYLSVALIGLAVYLILIPHIGMRGAAIGTIATEGLSALIGSLVVLRTVGFRLHFGLVRRVLLAAAAMAAVLWLIPGDRLLVELPVGIVVYAAALLAVRGVSPQLLRTLLKPESSQEG